MTTVFMNPDSKKDNLTAIYDFILTIKNGDSGHVYLPDAKEFFIFLSWGPFSQAESSAYLLSHTA